MKYEYSKIKISETNLLDKLNSLGEDGWQVVHVETSDSGKEFLLMRETDSGNKFQEPMTALGDLLGKIDFSKGFGIPAQPGEQPPEFDFNVDDLIKSFTSNKVEKNILESPIVDGCTLVGTDGYTYTLKVIFNEEINDPDLQVAYPISYIDILDNKRAFIWFYNCYTNTFVRNIEFTHYPRQLPENIKEVTHRLISKYKNILNFK